MPNAVMPRGRAPQTTASAFALYNQPVFSPFVVFSGGPASLAQVPPGIALLVALGIQYL
jgi:hypothetical protein